MAAVMTLLVATSVYAFAGRLGLSCAGRDTLTLEVAAAPEIAGPVTTAAEDFNHLAHRVDGRCVRAGVHSVDPSLTSALLSGRMPSGQRTGRPDVWIPSSSLWLHTAAPGSTAPDGRNAEKRQRLESRGPIALSPLVVAAATAHQDDAAVARSWRALLKEAAVPDEGKQSGNARLRFRVPDPGRTATGMTTLLLARTLLGNGEKAETEFAGLVRSIRQSTTPDMNTQLASLARQQGGRTPVVVVPELAVWAHNARGAPGGRAVAIYPEEGTLSLDYPFTIVPDDTQYEADGLRRQAALLLDRHLRASAAQDGFRAAGLRGQNGRGAPSFGPGSGVAVYAPRALPSPAPARVRAVAQAWARLSLGSRMLSMIDISGSMAAKVPGTNATRLQAIAAVSQEGLALQPDDTELGQWVFSTRLKGRQDWRENVSLGPLGQRIGSATRRQLILSALASLRPKPDGDTGLYDSLLAAFEHLTRTYKAEMINTVLLLTDGRNEDGDGPSLERTLERLRAAYDPERPVQIIMIGFGDGVDTGALRQIAGVTGGGVYVAERASDIRQIFRVAMARRLCAPDC